MIVMLSSPSTLQKKKGDGNNVAVTFYVVTKKKKKGHGNNVAITFYTATKKKKKKKRQQETKKQEGLRDGAYLQAPTLGLAWSHFKRPKLSRSKFVGPFQARWLYSRSNFKRVGSTLASTIMAH